MPTIKLTVAYDGTGYRGWQKTKEGASIEGELQASLEQILQQKISLNAAGRTDRGVHALGQVVSFEASRLPSLISLNQLLPPDIAILSVEEVPQNFHATLSAKSKTYRYELTHATYQIPQRRFFEWHYPHRLDAERMFQAAKMLTGKRDFKSLTNQKKGETYATTVRTVESITVETMPEGQVILTFKGENFLYKMVRNLVGLIVYVGAGKIDLKDIAPILEAKDRRLAAMSAPAHGLTLMRVDFANE